MEVSKGVDSMKTIIVVSSEDEMKTYSDSNNQILTFKEVEELVNSLLLSYI